MRILFASTQGAGHFGPLIPFVDAASRAGHEVLIVGPPTLKARGYPFRAGASPPDELLGPIWGRMPSLPPGQGDMVVVGIIFARLNVDAMLPALVDAIEEWRPDLVVREAAEFASAAAAELHGLPHVRVAVGAAMVEELALAIAGPVLDERRPGLAERVAASPYLTCWPELIDPSPYEAVRFRHPAAEARAEPLPDWWPGDERPLVYVSFGSVAATFPPAAQVYATALAAVAELPIRVLLDRRERGRARRRARERPRRELGQRAGRARARQRDGRPRRGGHHTSAMSAGCPLVTVPLFGDQPANGMRVAVAGAGVVAPMLEIARSIERVLERDSYREAALRVAGEMRALQPVDDFLERLPL